jgi:hypothetical protein
VGGLDYVMCLCNKSGVLSPKDYIYLCKKKKKSVITSSCNFAKKYGGPGLSLCIRYKKVGGGPLNSDAYVKVVEIRGQVVLAPC